MARAAVLHDNPASKLSKDSVDYSEGMGETRCRNCAHFIPPAACEIVRGPIDPEFWCERFAKR